MSITKRICLAILLTVVFASGSHSAPSAKTLGGLGTGSLDLLPDGRFGNSTANHNPHRPIARPEGAFAAIYTETNGRRIAKALHADGAYRSVERVEIGGAFPEAFALYRDDDLPVDVRLDAFSPFVPGDIRASSVPGVVLRYTVRNSSNQPVNVALAFSWPNLGGLLGDEGAGIEGTGIHQFESSGPLRGVEMRFTPNAPNRAIQNALSEYAVFTAPERGDQFSFQPAWNPSAAEEEFWRPFENQGGFGEASSRPIQIDDTVPNRPAAAVAKRRAIPAGGSSVFTFYVVWRQADQIDARQIKRTPYATSQIRSLDRVARELHDRWQERREAFHKWKNERQTALMSDSLFGKGINGLAYLASHSVLYDNGLLVPLTTHPDYPGNVISPEELLIAYPMLMQSFPDTVEPLLQLYADCQMADGEVPSAAGGLDSFLGSGDLAGGFMGRPDSVSAYALLIYMYALEGADADFFRELTPHLRAAVVWLYERDENRTGSPHGPSLIRAERQSGFRAETSGFYGAALRAGEDFAAWTGDIEFSSTSRQLRNQQIRNHLSQSWNGTYFHAEFAPRSDLQEDRRFATMPSAAFAHINGWRHVGGDELIVSHIHALNQRVLQGDNPFSSDLAPWLTAGMDAALLMTFGHRRAAERLWDTLTDQPHEGGIEAERLRDAGLWWAWRSAVGVGDDTQFNCLTVGAPAPLDVGQIVSPLHTARWQGRVEQYRSPANGQVRCDVYIESLGGERTRRLNEIAYRFATAFESDQAIMRVLHNGDIVGGQDFARETTRVFTFTRPILIRPGDSLTLVIAWQDGGRIRVNAQNATAVNLGAYCSITAQGSSAGFSFQVENLLYQPQIVFLEFEGAVAGDYEISLNGDPIPWITSSADGLPLLLLSGALVEADAQWLRRTLAASEEALRLIARHEPIGARDISRRLWDIQEETTAALALDAEMRGFHLEFTPTSVESGSQRRAQPASRNDLPRRLQRAKDMEQRFRNDIARLSPDPVLASLLIGCFAPITITAGASPTEGGGVPFNVAVETTALHQQALSYRIHLDLPQDWLAATDDPVQFDVGVQDLERRHSVLFKVTPAVDLWEERVALTATVMGVWEATPFRREVIVAVGRNFIREWLIIGPFSNQRGEGFSNVYPPELNIQPEEAFTGAQGTVQWQRREFPSGMIDVGEAMTPHEEGTAFAYVGVYSPREQRTFFHFGCNGDMKIFVNYREIFAQRHISQLRPGALRIPYTLLPGWNHVLVKLSRQTASRWGFYFEITDIEGKQIPDLIYALDRIE